jgi:hypothetical protein
MRLEEFQSGLEILVNLIDLDNRRDEKPSSQIVRKLVRDSQPLVNALSENSENFEYFGHEKEGANNFIFYNLALYGSLLILGAEEVKKYPDDTDSIIFFEEYVIPKLNTLESLFVKRLNNKYYSPLKKSLKTLGHHYQGTVIEKYCNNALQKKNYNRK